MKNKLFFVFFTIFNLSMLFAQEQDMDYYLYRNKETFSILHSMFGVIARDKVPVYKNWTHEFEEEPLFYLDKETIVKFKRVSKDSFQYKSGTVFHRWLIETMDDYREGWISGHDVILISSSKSFVPLYKYGTTYFYVNGGLNYDGKQFTTTGFTKLVTGSSVGSPNFYNGDVLFLEQDKGDSPFYLEWDNPHYENMKHISKWDEEAGCYVHQTIKYSNNNENIIEEYTSYENDSILKSRNVYKSEEYYELIHAIETDNISLLKKIIASGYRAEVMPPSESPLLYALDKNKINALSIMIEGGFDSHVEVEGEDDIYFIDIYDYKKIEEK